MKSGSVAIRKRVLQICATHIGTCPRRSVGMDAWSSDQLKRMQLGGNDKLNNFLQKYGVSKDTDIKEKYNSAAAEVRLPVRAALPSLSALLNCGSAGVQTSPCLLKAIRSTCILLAPSSSPISMLIVSSLFSRSRPTA